MTDLKFTKEDANEALFNLGKLAGRLNLDEGKRLAMLSSIVASYMSQLAEERNAFEQAYQAMLVHRISKDPKDDDFDMDGRC
jgi:hypothetical protein